MKNLMVKVFILGQMGTNMKENLRMVNLKAMVLDIIRMETNMRDSGKMI
jgi:hypothetical protein